MRNIVCTLIFSMVVAAGYAQTNIPEYKASNGVTYKEGDTVKLGRGTAPNGDFRYIQVMGLGMNTYDKDKNNLPRNYSDGNAVIKRVTNWRKKGADKFYVVVGVGLMNNYWIAIEDAIATCEIANCKDKNQPAAAGPDKYDQLAKLKKLLDDGVITQDEYDKEKKKLLEQQ